MSGFERKALHVLSELQVPDWQLHLLRYNVLSRQLG